jgi:hypothetical protein
MSSLKPKAFEAASDFLTTTTFITSSFSFSKIQTISSTNCCISSRPTAFFLYTSPPSTGLSSAHVSAARNFNALQRNVTRISEPNTSPRWRNTHRRSSGLLTRCRGTSGSLVDTMAGHAKVNGPAKPSHSFGADGPQPLASSQSMVFCAGCQSKAR